MIDSYKLRNLYLDFYKSKNHTIIPSSTLVPKEDPTVLFNTAGMQPIVPYLMGEMKHNGGNRLANSQKCIRTDDIIEVGDNRHCTFFEMLGNWSINDYFKEEIIPWSMEFLTSKKWLSLSPDRIFVTAYKGNESVNIEPDNESIRLWEREYLNLGITADIGFEHNFDSLKEKNPNWDTLNFSSTKYIIFDFDGVLGNTKPLLIRFIKEMVIKDPEFKHFSKSELVDLEKTLSEHFSVKKGDSQFQLTPLVHAFKTWILESKINQISVFSSVFETISTFKNCKFAIVTDNATDIVQKALLPILEKYPQIKFEHILTLEDGLDKNKKIQTVCKNWNIKTTDSIYITDTIRDQKEITGTVLKENIFCTTFGYCLPSTVFNHFPFQNIIQTGDDLLEIFKPKLKEIEHEQEKLVPKIRLMSGKDNWWGLPYLGPCGPCSEMYYLLAHNPIDFEQVLFPEMTLNQIDNFIENQIVELGNNVFMMYQGEKDSQKEPINVTDLGMKNVDTGLGFERYLAAINSCQSIYETDLYSGILDVINKHSN